MADIVSRCSVEDVILIGELLRRPSRPPDFEAENRALTSLAEAMTATSQNVLQQLVEMAMRLTRAESAGISLLEPGGPHGIFRWAATAGAWAPYRDGTMPREESPCGEVIAREAIIHVSHPERAWPALLQADPGIDEALLAPFLVDGAAGGTLWVIRHAPGAGFDVEDARLLQNLGRFASAAHRTVQALQSAELASQQSDLRFQQLVTLADVSSEFFGTCDMNFMPVYGNAAAMRMVGLADLDQVRRTPLSEFFFPEDLPFITDEFFPRVLRDGQAKVEIRFRHFVTGEPIWVDYSLVVLRDSMGQATGYGTVTHDLTERMRAEAALRESEERFRALALVGSSSIYRMSPDWREMRRLEGAAFLADTTSTTTDWLEAYIPAEEQPRVRAAIDQAIAGKRIFELEHRVLRADGKIGWTFSRAIPLFDDSGEIADWFGAATDITARVKADRSFTRLFEASPAPFLVLKPDAPRFTIIEVNDAYLSATMRTRDEVVGRGVFDAYPDNPVEGAGGSVNILRASLEKVLATRQPDTLPGLKYDIARPDGTFEERWWSPVNSVVLDDDGEVEALIHNANDVTEERRAEMSLRESEERQAFLLHLSDALRAEPNADALSRRALRMLFAHLQVDRAYIGIYRLTEDIGHFSHQVHNDHLPPLPPQVWLSDFPESLRVASAQTLIVKDIAEMETLSAIDQASLDQLGMRALIAASLRKGDGNPFWSMVVVSARPRDWTQGEIALVEEVAERTWAALERIRAETALRDSEGRYRTLFEAIDSGFCIIEMIFDDDGRAIDYRFVEANPALERQSGLTDVVGRRISELAPDLEKHWLDRYGHVALTGEAMRVEGEVAPLERWFDINAFRVGEPEQHRVAALFTDITERKKADAALRASQEQFEILLNQAPLGVYLVDSDFVIQQVNPIAAPVFGDIPGGPIGRDFDEVIRILWDKEYADEVVGIFRHTLETGEPYFTRERAEHRVDRDTIEYYEWRVDRILLSGGQYGVVCYFRDISAQVQARKEVERAREAARESAERFQQFSDASTSVIWIRDAATLQMEYASPAFEAIYGAPGPDDGGNRDLRGWARLIEPDFRKAVLDNFRRVRAGERTQLDFRISRGSQGEVRWIQDIEFPLFDEHGRVRWVAGIGQDITEHKHAEEALRDREDRLGLIVENARDYAIFTTDPAGIITDWRAGAEGVFGWSPAEAIGMHLSMLFTPEDRESGEPEREMRVAEEESRAADVRWHLRKDGTRVFIDGTLTRLGNGSTTGYLKIGQDMTERHRSQAALSASEGRLQTLMEGIPQLVWRSSGKGLWTWASPQWLSFTGQTQTESHGLGWLDAVHPDDRAGAMVAWEAAGPDGLLDVEYRVRRAADGAWIWHHTRSVPVRDAEGRIREWLGTSTDVQVLKQFQDRQEVLVGELQHRTRNLLGVVRSLSGQTIQRSKDLPEFGAAFDARLGALARVQGLLSRLESEERVTFDELLQAELMALGAVDEDGMGEKVTLDGPLGVRLRSTNVQTLALAIHELATNAAKYGALKQDSGRLEVTWRIRRDGDQSILCVDWHEFGVAMPAPADSPRGGGFGRELIEQALPFQLAAETSFVLGPDGVRCTIALPMRGGASLSTAVEG